MVDEAGRIAMHGSIHYFIVINAEHVTAYSLQDERITIIVITMILQTYTKKYSEDTFNFQENDLSVTSARI